MFLLAATVALLTGCSSVTVNRDYAADTDFSALKTYAWKHEVQPRTGNPRVDNDLVDQRIRTAVDATLNAKGFSAADASAADFLLAYYLEYRRRISGSTWSFGLGSGYYDRYGSVGYNSSINDYDEACLTVDVIDRDSGKAIWRGVGIRTTYESTRPDKVTKIVNHAVERILADFPPQP
jgi:hypothetical protein